MTPLRRRLSPLELGLIAAALLLPIPLVALNGYAAALPDAVGRGLGSLVTLEAGDERSGTEVRGNASEDGSGPRRSGHALLSIRRGTGTSAGDKSAASGGSGRSAAPDTTDDEESAAPQGEAAPQAPDENGDTGGSEPAADGGSEAPNRGEPAAADAGKNTPALSVSGGGQGTAAGASLGSEGVTVDLDGDSGGAGGSGGVSIEVRDTDGSSTGIGIGVPSTGGVIP